MYEIILFDCVFSFKFDIDIYEVISALKVLKITILIMMKKLGATVT